MTKRRDKGDGSIYQRASDKKWVGYARIDQSKKKYVYGNTKAEASKKLILNAEQCQQLLKAAQGTDLECFLAMALTTGMRRGEMLGLRWSDIDMEKKFLSVQRTASFLNSSSTGKYSFVETSTKTKASRRAIRLTDFLLSTLKLHKKRQLEMRLQAGQEWVNKDLVFCGLRGEHFAIATLLSHYKRLLQECGFPPMRIHDLRHSCATLLASMGVPAKVIQEILGHSSITTTQDLYGHVINGMQEEAMEKMNDLFREERVN